MTVSATVLWVLMSGYADTTARAYQQPRQIDARGFSKIRARFWALWGVPVIVRIIVNPKL